jgi:cell division septal protein FtsQ
VGGNGSNEGKTDVKPSVKIALSLIPGIIFVVVLIILIVQVDTTGSRGMAEVSMSGAAFERAIASPSL